MKIKCWIDFHTKMDNCEPSVHFKKLLKREIKNLHEFGYKIFECTIIINKEVK